MVLPELGQRKAQEKSKQNPFLQKINVQRMGGVCLKDTYPPIGQVWNKLNLEMDMVITLQSLKLTENCCLYITSK